jgi:hypothetical protein
MMTEQPTDTDHAPESDLDTPDSNPAGPSNDPEPAAEPSAGDNAGEAGYPDEGK